MVNDDRPRHHVSPVLLQMARANRRPMTAAEQRLWECIRDRKLGGHKFRRQRTVDQFVVDFCCMERRLVVELDGSSHDGRAEYDAERTERLGYCGYRVVRFTNDDVTLHLPEVLKAILRECKAGE